MAAAACCRDKQDNQSRDKQAAAARPARWPAHSGRARAVQSGLKHPHARQRPRWDTPAAGDAPGQERMARAPRGAASAAGTVRGPVGEGWRSSQGDPRPPARGPDRPGLNPPSGAPGPLPAGSGGGRSRELRDAGQDARRRGTARQPAPSGGAGRRTEQATTAERAFIGERRGRGSYTLVPPEGTSER